MIPRIRERKKKKRIWTQEKYGRRTKQKDHKPLGKAAWEIKGLIKRLIMIMGQGLENDRKKSKSRSGDVRHEKERLAYRNIPTPT